MKLFNFRKPKVKSNVRNVVDMPLEDYLKLIPDFSGSVSVESATKIAAVYRAILLRSENIASLPKSVKKLVNDSWESTDHIVNNIFHYPNQYTNGFDFWNNMIINLDSYGNSYAIIDRDDKGFPIALHQLKPTQVSILFGKGVKKIRVTGHKWLDGEYSNEDFLHFMMFSFDGILGVNPIQYNSATFAKAIACRKFGQEFFEKGGHIKGVLEMDGSLADDNYEDFIKKFKQSGNFGTPLLEYGIKYKNIGVTPITAQLLSTEEFSIQDISRVFGVPTPFLSELSRATFSNIEQQNMWFTQYSLRPTCKRIELEMENKLFFAKERGKYSINFNLTGILRGDSQSRADYLTKLIQSGVYTRNEARTLEGLPKKDGLDEIVYQGNLIGVNDKKE
jgi:HK97 family phage portal protein